MKFVYQCSECGRKYPIKPDIMLCQECSKKQEEDKPLRGILEVAMKKPYTNISSIFDVLPVEQTYFPNIPIGNTPLWVPHNLQKKLDMPNLLIKDDTGNPTGSYKDRASWLVSAFARKWNIADITVASTGNAASSMAGVGAAAGQRVTIFVPENIPRAKLIQSLQYGARVLLVKGSYDNAFRLSMEYQPSGNAINRNTGYNPLTTEGKKTAAFELWQQLQKLPDFVFVPTGDAVVLSGLLKGFQDLQELGLSIDMPVFIAVQAENSNALSRAFEQGDFGPPVKAHTMADSISVDVPANGYYALHKLKDNNTGFCIQVSDDQILKAQQELASTCGLFVEPSSAATYAGLLKIKNRIPQSATVVLMATGNGMKDREAAEKGVQIPQTSIEKPEDIND